MGNAVGIVLEERRGEGRRGLDRLEHRREQTRSHLDALQPPPEGVAAVVASRAALAQQVGDQSVAQRSSKSQDDVAASEEAFAKRGFWFSGFSSVLSVAAGTYRASTCLPVSSMRPLRAMKVSLPQQRKIPAEK